MPADLQLWHPDHLGDAKGKLQFRVVNTLNAPILSSPAPTWLGNGAAIADVYELVFTNNAGTVTATRECLIEGTKNPYRNMTGVPVVADGVTVNKNLIPGLGLVVSASVATGWKARVAIRNYLDLADDGDYTAFLSWGIIQAGITQTGRKIAVKNVGDSDAALTVLYVTPGFYIAGGSYESFIAKIEPHSNPTRHKMAVAGSYVLTFADWKDAGGGKKSADLYVDGVKAIEDAIFNGTTLYEYGSGNGYDDGADKLKGLLIVLADTTADPTSLSLTLHVTADYTWVEFAPDVSGAPGSYANQDLDLTQSGQPTGTILAGGSALFWMRENPPLGATVGALRKRCLFPRGLTV